MTMTERTGGFEKHRMGVDDWRECFLLVESLNECSAPAAEMKGATLRFFWRGVEKTPWTPKGGFRMARLFSTCQQSEMGWTGNEEGKTGSSPKRSKTMFFKLGVFLDPKMRSASRSEEFPESCLEIKVSVGKSDVLGREREGGGGRGEV